MPKKKQETPDFEQAFQQLEQTVAALEKGGLALAQATTLYEEGMRLAQLCGQRLDQAELKITELQAAYAGGSHADEDPSEDLLEDEDEND